MDVNGCSYGACTDSKAGSASGFSGSSNPPGTEPALVMAKLFDVDDVDWTRQSKNQAYRLLRQVTGDGDESGGLNPNWLSGFKGDGVGTGSGVNTGVEAVDEITHEPESESSCKVSGIWFPTSTGLSFKAWWCQNIMPKLLDIMMQDFKLSLDTSCLQPAYFPVLEFLANIPQKIGPTCRDMI